MKKNYFKYMYNACLFFLIALATKNTAQTSVTYSFTGAMQTFTVPTCVTSITVDVRGSKGGDCIYNQPGTKPDDLGGLGGRVVAVYPVTPGQILNIFVGGIQYNGGGTGGGSIAQAHGGGASDIRVGGTTLADRVIVAGGGGGGGNNCSVNAEPGGNGGGLVGANGSQCGTQSGTAIGLGGTQTAGGAAGTNPATPGTFGIGGNAGGTGTASGGGGGGYYGGGGAAYGGGGGGSSYTNPSATSVMHTQGFQNNTGEVIITYVLNTVATINTSSPFSCNGAPVTLSANLQSYLWSNGATTYSTQVTPTVTTTYSVSGTDLSGCPVQGTVSVIGAATPTVALLSASICSGNATTLTANSNPDVTYSWDTGELTASISVTPTVTTDYTVTVTNTCGTNTAAATVTVNTTPTVSAVTSQSSICTGEVAILTASGSSDSNYLWDTGETTFSISVSPTVTTIYTVTATNSCGSTTTTVTQDVSLCTAIKERLNAQEISFYPNPAKNDVSITINNSFAPDKMSVEITDALGKVIQTNPLTGKANSINISQLDNGIYFFKVITNDKIIRIEKIVKQ